jgi:translocation protein SEC63
LLLNKINFKNLILKGATEKEIRKQYRELSKIMHPDRGGSPEKFKDITRALKSLTDSETKKNWEEFGNPDGPGATHFGIALPKWMVDDKNSMFVLGFYVLVFMIIMPTVVVSFSFALIMPIS